MNRMLQELLRWQKTSFALPSHRWTDWVRSLNRGRDRIIVRQQTLTMNLERRYPLIHIYQRWQRQTWQLLPQINLSIGSILREIERRKEATFWFERRQDKFASIPLLTNTNNSILRLEPNYLIRSFASPISIQPSPLQQAFNRLERSLATTHLYRSELVRESQKIIQRVIRGRQRLEEQIQCKLVLKQPLEVKDAIARPLIPSQHHLSTDIPPNFQPNPPPNSNAINLDRLTEQVLRQLDSRIIAQRERMGRTF